VTPTAGSVFSGLDGLGLAAEALGFQVRWQVEADPWRRQVLAARWPEVARHGDIKEVTARDLEPVDLVVAGPPCQPISNAGRWKAQADPRWLWEELARLLRDLRPGHVFLENPAALLGRGMGIVLGLLAACGYVESWRCLRALDVGAPHQRDRVWILARLPDADLQGLKGTALVGKAAGEPGPDAAGGGPRSLVALWPTPLSSDGQGGRRTKGRSRQGEVGLPSAVADAVLWPTPTASNPNEFEDLYSWQARQARVGRSRRWPPPAEEREVLRSAYAAAVDQAESAEQACREASGSG
jgi:site-specific DNA-cytosine methylase